MSELIQLLTRMNTDNTDMQAIADEHNVPVEGSTNNLKRLVVTSMILNNACKTVFETGFNYGGMALSVCRALAIKGGKYTAFDIKTALQPVWDNFQTRVGDNCETNIVWGDSTLTLPKYLKDTGEVPDLFIADGGHSPAVLTADINNALSVMKSGFIIIDDAFYGPLKKTIQTVLEPRGGLIWSGISPTEPGLAVFQIKG